MRWHILKLKLGKWLGRSFIPIEFQMGHITFILSSLKQTLFCASNCPELILSHFNLNSFLCMKVQSSQVISRKVLVSKTCAMHAYAVLFQVLYHEVNEWAKFCLHNLLRAIFCCYFILCFNSKLTVSMFLVVCSAVLEWLARRNPRNDGDEEGTSH